MIRSFVCCFHKLCQKSQSGVFHREVWHLSYYSSRCGPTHVSCSMHHCMYVEFITCLNPYFGTYIHRGRSYLVPLFELICTKHVLLCKSHMFYMCQVRVVVTCLICLLCCLILTGLYLMKPHLIAFDTNALNNSCEM